MIGFIITCWSAFALICIREFTALRTPSSCATITSESPTRNNTGLTKSFSDYLQSGKVFQRQNTSFTANRNQSPHSDDGTPQAASGDQDRKSTRFLVPRLIIAIMNQHPVNNSENQRVRNSTDAQKNYVSEKTITLRDDQPKKRVEMNTVDPLDETSITFTDNSIEENTTESSKTTSDNNKKNTTSSTPIEVSLKDRSNFDAEGCPSGYAKVNGKCVPIQN